MTEQLTSADIKRVVRQLQAARSRSTKPCPDCGGDGNLLYRETLA
jgi:hypothetical protein